MNDLALMRHEVSQSSAGGAPFLISFGVSLGICAIASFWLARETAALLVMFQGGVALPVAFWLEKKMAWGPMAKENPLNTLSVQLAMSQILAFPVVIAMFDLAPGAVPLAMASIAGGHFLPYAWLQRTSVYAWLGAAVSFGGLAIQILAGANAFPYVLLNMTVCYWIGAVLVYRAAWRMTRDAETLQLRSVGIARP